MKAAAILLYRPPPIKAEGDRRGRAGSPRADFQIRNSIFGEIDQMRLAIIGNCQAPNLRNALLRRREVQVKYMVDVNDLGSDYTKWCIEQIKNKNDVDVVLSQPLSDEFGDISSSFISSIYDKNYIKMTNIYFLGLHPDISYYGAFNMRVPSPMGDYHSKIALTCFLKGYSADECLKRFSASSYERMGYFSIYQSSMRELENRDESNGIKFAQDFGFITRNQLSLLAVNHPTSIVFAEFAGKILTTLTGKTSRVDPNMFINQLSGSAIWPVYPEIAEANHLPYRTEMLFYGHSAGEGRSWTLEEFVRESYDLYSRTGFDNMMSISLAPELIRVDI